MSDTQNGIPRSSSLRENNGFIRFQTRKQKNEPLLCTIDVQIQNLHRSIGKTIAWFAVWIIVKSERRSID